MRSRVASLDLWLELVAGRLIDGEKFLLQSLPGTGKTLICKRLSALLGPTAVVFNGRHIAAASSTEAISRISNSIVATVASEGSAQLLFDDYSLALTSVPGQQLQAVLHGLLVNSQVADAIGTLVTARLGDRLDISRAGSPLLSRLDYLAEPAWASADIPLGKAAESVEQEIGPTAGMLAIALGPDSLYDPRRVTRHLDLYGDLILTGCTVQALQYLAGRRTFADLMPTDKEPMSGLLASGGLTTAARDSDLRRLAMSRSPGWPVGLRECATTFASLVEGRERVMWVDRYLFKRPPNLRRFLIEVRKLTSTQLSLLGSNPPWDPIDQAAINRLSTEVPGVECRALTAVQYRRCHDRHLVFPDDSGHVLPVAEVVMGSGEPGTAVTTHVPAFPEGYARYWRGSARL